ncbi:MAG: 23S rRNA (pseudouridine(1915)-N(3))-methyltransferase RlmH [Acidobacteriia bacterium]|nr:23S rRNA (pseudouridine(1915)-N(3))-methyltransferase RlmH [Terriglobia bacterium]
MNGILLVWVGRRAPEPYETLCRDYARRLTHYVPLSELRVVPAEGRAADRRRALTKEAAAIRRHLAPGDTVVPLDESGRERTTEELAQFLREQTRLRRVAFVIGSDLGLDAEIKDAADDLLALSRLTLPHHLARLVLLEQLYRACDLLAGGQYHRGRSG